MSVEDFILLAGTTVFGGIGLSLCIVIPMASAESSARETEMKNLIQTIVDTNNVDNFTLDMVKFNNYVVEFIGEKEVNKNIEYGSYNYTISIDSHDYYENCVEIIEKGRKQTIIENDAISSSLCKNLNYLVENETSTWTKYSPEQIFDTQSEIASLKQSIKTKKETEELSM